MFQEVRPYGVQLQDPVGVDSISIVTQSTELDDFYHETVSVSDGQEVTFLTTDISLLFNQQRLMQASPLALDRLVNNLKSARPDSLKGLTDDQLASIVKSRYIQSASDMQDYMRTIMMNMDDEVEAIKAKIAEMQSQQETPSQDSAESSE